MQRQSIKVGEGGFCALICDPYVLFPHADLRLSTIAHVAESGILILADGFAVHDPHQGNQTFARFTTDTRVMRPNGARLVTDAGSIGGDELAAQAGALGGMAAAATVLVIAPPDRLAGIAAIEAAADATGCLAGATAAPNDSGIAMRLLARDGGTLARGIEAAFGVAARAALRTEIARRRK